MISPVSNDDMWVLSLGWVLEPIRVNAFTRLALDSAVIRHRDKHAPEKRGRPGSDARLILLTVPQVRRLLTRLIWTVRHPADFVLSWSQWRRMHQARAQKYHYQLWLSLLAPIVRL